MAVNPPQAWDTGQLLQRYRLNNNSLISIVTATTSLPTTMKTPMLSPLIMHNNTMGLEVLITVMVQKFAIMLEKGGRMVTSNMIGPLLVVHSVLQPIFRQETPMLTRQLTVVSMFLLTLRRFIVMP